MTARPIPVAAYPADTPRWVTHHGRRQRVVAFWEQPPHLLDSPAGVRYVRVELAGGQVLTLLHDRGGWYQGRRAVGATGAARPAPA